MKIKTQMFVLLVTASILSISACGIYTVANNTPILPAVSTEGVLCDFSQKVFNSHPLVKNWSSANWSCANSTRKLVANGVPDHDVGPFNIQADLDFKIEPQSIQFSVPIAPVLTSSAKRLGGPMGDIAYLVNGIKIDAGTGGSCNNSGSNCTLLGRSGPWQMEALGQSSFSFGADNNNAHVQPGGVYHYHGMPEGLIKKLNKGKAMTLVGWAADGFPIYARYGYSQASHATSEIKIIQSSYRIKLEPMVNRPATSLYPMGTFVQDYEYVASLGDLDECNGRVGVTPEFPNGIYHYYATDSYPYLPRCVKGAL